MAAADVVAADVGSDMRLKHDIVLLGRLDDGLGYYRFVYNGGHTAYVGVMAQQVQTVMPEAVTRGPDGYMRVSYDRLGLPFQRPMSSGSKSGAAFTECETGRAMMSMSPGSRHARRRWLRLKSIAGTRTRTTTMTMRIGGILAAAVLIAAAIPARAQETYPTPEAAVKDLVNSAKAKTPGFGDRILGKDGAALLRSGDADEDAGNLKSSTRRRPCRPQSTMAHGTKILRVGKNGWTLPLPLIKSDAGWRFDVARGKEEMTNRRVGYNELSAIEACKAYVAAQDEYFKLDRDGNGLREYARRIISTPEPTMASTGRRKTKPIFRRSTDSRKTPIWLGVRARSRSLTTAITSAS